MFAERARSVPDFATYACEPKWDGVPADGERATRGHARCRRPEPRDRPVLNREIAQSPSFTRRTVELHLSYAFRKLEIASRTQMADALAAGEQTAVGT